MGKTATIQYCTAAAAVILAALVAYMSYTSWSFYSYSESAVREYDCANYTAAFSALSPVADSYFAKDPGVTAFHAHLLSLQDYHDQAISLLEKSGLVQEGAVMLALASERLFVHGEDNTGADTETAMLEKAVNSYPYPDALVALGGAHLYSGELEKAAARLQAAREDAGRLSFDGLLALWINTGILYTRQENYKQAAENFKKVIDLLPKRDLPALSGTREKMHLAGQRGLALACASWLKDEAARPEEQKAAVDYVTGMLDEKQATSRGPKERWDLGNYTCILLNALGVAQGRLKLHKEASRTFKEAQNAARRLRTENRDSIRLSIELNEALTEAQKLSDAETPGKNELTSAAKDISEIADSKALSGEQRYALFNLSAKLYLQADNKRKTEQTFKKAIELMPDDAAAVVNLAVAYDILGEKAEAVEYYEKALEFDKLENRPRIEIRVAALKEQK